jgi:hypothetical protein
MNNPHRKLDLTSLVNTNTEELRSELERENDTTHKSGGANGSFQQI